MKRRSSRKILESLCGQPGPEDGLDPREFFKPQRDRKQTRKDWQLCRQVFETLNYVLADGARDDVIRSLAVSEVVPAPDATRLLVTLHPMAPDDSFDPATVLERLRHDVGRLRSEIARSISRRKVPELVFQIVRDTDFPVGDGVRA